MRRLQVCVALVLVTAPCATAQAQRDGISIDPNGPTAREYEIPLEAERRRGDASVGGGVHVRRSDPVPGDVAAAPAAPLFGRGVTPQAAQAQRARVREGSAPDAPDAEGSAPDAPDADDERAGSGLPSVARLERQASSPDRSMLMAGGGILALGLVGCILRRRVSLRT